MSQENPSAPSPPSRRLGLYAAIVTAALVAAFAVSSLAEARPRWMGGHGHHGGAHGEFDVERAEEHAEYAIGWVLRDLDASDEQRTRIEEIVSATIREVAAALREPHREHRDAFADLLSQESIDRDRLEALRTQELALAEQASSVLSTAIADIAETLTLEQRSQLMAHMKEHRGRHAWR